jgi:two-component system NtrC family sensor kinase
MTDNILPTLNDNETILVIDDSPANLDFLYVILAHEGYQVLVESHGESALELVKNHLVDLILLDVVMPKISGFEMCNLLKAEPATRDVPIIFMTALSEPEEKVKGLSIGAVDYITKPFQEEEILARIKIHLKMRRLNLEIDLQKQQLEHRVLERTAELSQTLEELKKTQIQLVQSEKISSLGQLVAGVAHEVNNPLGFISSNLHYATQYIRDLINLVKLYQEQFPNPGHKIEEEILAMDLDHVVQDLPKLISSMKLGTDRIQGIMQSLRNFSRPDGNQKKAVNIHDGLETTLMLLQHRLKAQRKRPTIEVIKDYGNLPLVECYPGQLNQVFMNLLANAIDALDELFVNQAEKRKNHTTMVLSPQIRICTTVDKKQATILIADNGPGMSHSIKSQIFKPYFTTKPEGKGTGLGLSISHQIVVEQHKGELSCISSPGEGTEFAIKIPVRCSKPKASRSDVKE